jgi:hypothetical protein
MNPIPAIPMLSSNGNGKVLLVFGILLQRQLLPIANKRKQRSHKRTWL